MFSFTVFVLLGAISVARNEPISKSPDEVVVHDEKWKEKHCADATEKSLENVLGSAYNPRYMSIRRPRIIRQEGGRGSAKKKYVGEMNPEDFTVDVNYEKEVFSMPAWAVKSHKITVITNDKGNKRDVDEEEQKEEETTEKKDENEWIEDDLITVEEYNKPELFANRTKRFRGKTTGEEWMCDSRVVWLDLGKDYFPRFLRTVQCLSSVCWNGHYECRSRAFTLKILRRKDVCVKPEQDGSGSSGLPQELREKWVWEQKAVNFCCDCVRINYF